MFSMSRDAIIESILSGFKEKENQNQNSRVADILFEVQFEALTEFTKDNKGQNGAHKFFMDALKYMCSQEEYDRLRDGLRTFIEMFPLPFATATATEEEDEEFGGEWENKEKNQDHEHQSRFFSAAVEEKVKRQKRQRQTQYPERLKMWAETENAQKFIRSFLDVLENLASNALAACKGETRQEREKVWNAFEMERNDIANAREAVKMLLKNAFPSRNNVLDEQDRESISGEFLTCFALLKEDRIKARIINGCPDISRLLLERYLYNKLNLPRPRVNISDPSTCPRCILL